MNKIEMLENGNVKLTIKMSLRNCAGRKRVIASDDSIAEDLVVVNIARAFRWQAMIDEGKFANVNELARALGRDKSHVSRTIRLTLLSPEVIHAAITGKLKKEFGLERFKQAFPVDWDEQRKFFGIEE
jgi:hypothetical protein